MEFLLLWVDELDDAVSTLRHLMPSIVGFLTALALFAATGAALVLAPQITVPVAGVVLSASLLEMARRRRSRALSASGESR
jgi:hypothetical protein